MVAELFPCYEHLPEPVKGYKCSWDYFNSTTNGERDGLGTLNFITAGTRRHAVSEVVTGESISLDLPIGYFAPDSTAFGGRPPPKHTVLSVGRYCFEDAIDFNTQSASQWDGFRHFGLPAGDGSYIFYNNWTAEDIKNSNTIGTDAWMRAGGIATRGVLVDFVRWTEQQGRAVDPNGGQSITLEDIVAVLTSQGTSVRPGDVLIFRTGWLRWYTAEHPTTRHIEMCERHTPGGHRFIGVEAARSVVSWLWDNQIAAVAGDQVAFESTPFQDNGFGSLHEHLLAALGCPIGELWDTEVLSKACQSRGSWSFLLTASPLHVPGGVASPANAIAIL